jgi:hypothetical protein
MTGLLKAVRQQKGRRGRAVALILSAATVVALAGHAAKHSWAATPDVQVDPVTTASLAPSQVPHELRIELTRPGTEAVDLAARLHDVGGLITRPIDWKIRRMSAVSGPQGAITHQESASAISPQLEPGDYIIEATYGYHKVAHPVTLLPGQRLGITLILNVGGIRPLSRLQHTELPIGIDAQHAIYALSGPQRGHRIVSNAGQGHVLRVAAGTYRIESRFMPGNTVAETKVIVKPGILSSMEVAHQAGLARITVGTDHSAAVAWEIRSLNSTWSRNQTTPEAAMVLAPGRYEVKAIVNGTVVTEEFAIHAGENRHVRLGYQ